MIASIVFAVVYLGLVGFAYTQRDQRPQERWLFGYLGFSAALMGLHAFLLSGSANFADPFSVQLVAVIAMVVSLCLLAFLTLSYIGIEPPLYLIGVAVVWLIGILIAAFQNAPPLLGGRQWIPEELGVGFSLSTEIIVIGWILVAAGLFGFTIRAYLREPRPLYANRLLYWTALVPLLVMGDGLAALVSPPWNYIGYSVRLLGAVGALYGIIAYRIFDFRDVVRWIIGRAILTAVLGAALFGGFYGALSLPFELDTVLLAIATAAVLAIAIQPVYQLMRWVLRNLIDRDVADATEAVRQYSQEIGGVIELQELAKTATQTINDLLQTRRSYLILATRFEDRLIMEAIGKVASRDDVIVKPGFIMLESPIYTRLKESDQPLLQYDLDYRREFQAISDVEREYLTGLEMDIFAPIIRDEELIGILALGPKANDQPFRPSEVELLTALANQTVAALENARLVADLKQLNTQISALNETLRESNERLERLDEVKSDFIDIASHELRTPLTQIRGYTALLMEMADRSMLTPDETKDIMQSLTDASQRMSDVIASMLDVSQIDVESLDLNFIETTLSNVLKLAIEPFTDAIHERGLTLTARGLRNLPPIHADYQRLVQAFQNLITNAIKFTPDGGKINVIGEIHERTEEGEPSTVRIAIEDTGIGIDEEHQEMIFDKFFRVGSVALHSTGSTKFKGAGPGLGLPITKGIIDAHGGRIWAESEGYDEEVMPGTTFSVVLPVRPPAMDAKKRMMELKEEAEAAKDVTVISHSPFSS